MHILGRFDHSMLDVVENEVAKRYRLPARRCAVSYDLADKIGGGRLGACQVMVGFDVAGQVKEVFIKAAKEGQDLGLILDDLAIIISLALQHGIPAEALAKSMSRLPFQPLKPHQLDPGAAPPLRKPASIVGAIIDLICREPEQSSLEYQRSE